MNLKDREKFRLMEQVTSWRFFNLTVATLLAILITFIILFPQLAQEPVFISSTPFRTPQLQPWWTDTPVPTIRSSRTPKIKWITFTATPAGRSTQAPTIIYINEITVTPFKTDRPTPTATPTSGRIIIDTPLPTATYTYTPTKTPSNTPTKTPTQRPPNSYEPGSYRVPEDIKPGAYKGYKTDASVEWCYWSKLDEYGEIIVGDVVYEDAFVVDIFDSYYFTVSGCYVTLIRLFTPTPTNTPTPTDTFTPTFPPTFTDIPTDVPIEAPIVIPYATEETPAAP